MKKGELYTVIGLSLLAAVLIGVLIYIIVTKTMGYTGNEADPFFPTGPSIILTGPGISASSISGGSGSSTYVSQPLGYFYFD